MICLFASTAHRRPRPWHEAPILLRPRLAIARAIAGRHAKVHARQWYTAALPPVCEPLILLLAFGLGLGSQISAIQWQGQDLSYLSYLAPGMLAYTAFMTAFFQSLFGAYIRMHYQKVWEGQLCTQVRLEHVIWGEVLWASILATIYATLVLVVLSGFALAGYVAWEWQYILLTLPFLWLTAAAFSCLGLLFMSIVPSIDHMNLPFFLVVMPIGFTSSTYFPLESESVLIQLWQAINPLHHIAEGCRHLLLSGEFTTHLVYGPLMSILLIAVFIPLTMKKLRKRVLGEVT